MKYIFRYAIITQYTSNPENLQPKDLISTLNSARFTQTDRIQSLLQTSRNCIDTLLKAVGKPNQLTPQSIKQTMNQYFSQEANINIDQLVQIWQNEKGQILGKILNESCKAQGKFVKVDWQVCSRIGSRKQENVQEKLAILTICSEDSEKNTSRTAIQLRKDQLNKVVLILGSAINFLDQNLK